MSVKYYKSTFEKIAEEKQNRIINTAINQFARFGYSSTSINTIAKEAEISIGSMYSYFESKEALFMTVLDSGYQYLEEALEEVIHLDGDIYAKLRRMLGISLTFAKTHQEINQIYIDVSTEGLSHLANKISRKMESATAAFYHSFIEQAKEEGIFRKDIDTRTASFFIDNQIMMVQFAYSSDYFRERMRIYTGEENYQNEEKLLDTMLDILKNGLMVKK